MNKLVSTFCCFLAACTLQAQTFSSTVNEILPDDGTTVYYDIQVSGLPSVMDTLFGLEQVCLNINHPYTEDMNVKLQSPNGSIILLFGGIGGGGDDFTNTCLSGTGPGIAAGTPPYTGTFQCMGVLGNFNKGQNPNGIWTLILNDTYAFADQGFLIDWSITFGNNPARPFIFHSSNLPIIKLTTIGAPIVDDPKVPVLMQIINNGPNVRNDPNQTTYAYEGTIMTEWQGFTGPFYPKKNYDFELVDAEGNDLDTTILGMPKESDWIFKAEYLDKTLLKNSITYEMARRMGVYAPRTRHCEIVLDGEYIGLYTLTEKVKRDKNRIDIAKITPEDVSGDDVTGGYIFEMNINNSPGDWSSPYPPINFETSQQMVEFKHVYPNSEDIQPEQRDYLRGYVDSFENVLLAPDFDNPETGYRKYLGVKSFIDFLIVNEYSVNYDSYGRSTYLVKEKITDGGKVKCGPPWDYDRALDYNNPNSTNGWVWEITHPYWPFPFWWSRMWEDPVYRKELACRWTMLRQGALKTSEFEAVIDGMKNQIDEGQTRNFQVWNELGAMTYDTHIDSLKSYLFRRLNWIDAALAAEQVAAPDFYLPADTLLCTGIPFDAGQFIGTQYTYNWQPGPDAAVITFNQEGLYHLVVTDPHGCFARKPVYVTLAPPPDATFTSQQLNGSNQWAFTPNNLNAASYHWDFGDGNVSTETSPQHSYAAPGVYTVSLTLQNTGSCALKEQNTLQFLVSSTENLTAFEGQIFPNPFREQIQINFQQPPAAEFTVTLENELGQTLISKQFAGGAGRYTLNTERIPSGVYLLNVTWEQHSWSLKMIRE